MGGGLPIGKSHPTGHSPLPTPHSPLITRGFSLPKKNTCKCSLGLLEGVPFFDDLRTETVLPSASPSQPGPQWAPGRREESSPLPLHSFVQPSPRRRRSDDALFSLFFSSFFFSSRRRDDASLFFFHSLFFSLSFSVIALRSPLSVCPPGGERSLGI